ncbi:MAG: lecithin retinol acyltransferase family protein [Phycisphaerales bacterium]
MSRQLLPGQHIKVSRFFYSHHGIFMGFHQGSPVVAELAKPPDGGVVRLVWLETFARGAQLEVVEHADGVALDQVVRNVVQARGWRKYDLFDWNCEHFANWCSTHQVRSLQVEGLSTAAIFVLGLWLLGKLGA